MDVERPVRSERRIDARRESGFSDRFVAGEILRGIVRRAQGADLEGVEDSVRAAAALVRSRSFAFAHTRGAVASFSSSSIWK